MTDLLAPPGDTAARRAAPPAAPRARRWRRSRWRDGRLIAGVLLMLVAVVVGARVVGGAGRQVQWVALRQAVPAGHVLTQADLTQVAAHLSPAASGQYFTSEPTQLAGRTVTRALAAGELLPAGAVTTQAPAASRVLPLLVKAGRLPTLVPGDRVDVYVLAAPSGRGGSPTEKRVLRDVEFIAADVLSSGDTSIQLRVGPADVISAVAASQSERVDVVRIDRDAAGSPGEAGPDSGPAYGG